MDTPSHVNGIAPHGALAIDTAAPPPVPAVVPVLAALYFIASGARIINSFFPGCTVRDNHDGRKYVLLRVEGEDLSSAAWSAPDGELLLEVQEIGAAASGTIRTPGGDVISIEDLPLFQAAELNERCLRLAAALLLGANWGHPGDEEDLQRLGWALSGGLSESGVEDADARRLLSAVTELAGDPNDQSSAVGITAFREGTGQKNRSWHELGEMIGKDVVALARQWIEASVEAPPKAAATASPTALSAATGVKQAAGNDDDPAWSFTPVSAPWGLMPLSNFLAIQFAPADWLYQRFVPAKSTTIIIAAPNAGKTLLAIEIVAAVAARSTAQRPYKVVVIEEEGAGGAFQERLRMAFAARSVSAHANVRVTWNSGRSLLNRTDLNDLLTAIRGSDLVVFDSLSALSAGMDENASGEMALLANEVHRLQVESGAAILVLHHSTKEGWKPGEIPSLRQLRGHGALAGRADAVIALVSVPSAPGSVAFEVHNLKQRDGERAAPLRAEVQMAGDQWTFRMEPLGRPPSSAPAAKADPISELVPRVLEAIPFEDSGASMKRADVQNLIKKRKEHVNGAITRLIDAGSIGEISGKQLVRLRPTTTGSQVPAVPGTDSTDGSGFPPLKGGTVSGTEEKKAEPEPPSPPAPNAATGNDAKDVLK